MATEDALSQPVAETFLLEESDAESGAGADADAESISDSIRYGAEPFRTFRKRVHELAITVVWPNANSEHVTVNRMNNGGFNRILGITWELDGHKLNHIVRVPWLPDDYDLEDQVAPLNFVKQHTKIPVPTVIEYDSSSENSLGLPYVIQDRVTGVDLHRMVHPENKIPHDGWKKLAFELGRVYRQILAVKSTAPGKLVLSPNGSGSLHVGPFQTSTIRIRPSQRFRVAAPSQIPPRAILALFKALFNFEREKELSTRPSADYRSPLPKLSQMAEELADAGYFQDLDYTLCHLNISAHNILVDPSIAGTRNPKNRIAAILAWDSALLAPGFMTCLPPAWLWNLDSITGNDEDDYGEEDVDDGFDESLYLIEPSTEQGKELKAIFDDAAGPEFVYYAYDPVYRLARRLFRFAIEGVHSSLEYEAAWKLLDEWEGMKVGENSSVAAPPSRAGTGASVVEEAPRSPPPDQNKFKREKKRKWKRICAVM